MIHRSIGVKALLKSLHILLFPRGFFFDNPLFSNALSLITAKKWEIRSMSATAGTTARCAFFEQGFGRRRNAQPFIHGGLRSTFLPIGAQLGMADGLNYSSKRGEAVVTVLPHGRTRKRELQSAKSSHLSNYESTPCAIRVKR